MESQLGQLLMDFPDLVVVLDTAGNLMWANRLAEHLFGRVLRDSIGQPAFDFVHPDDLELVARSFVSVQGKQIGNPIEVRLRTANGWRLVELIGARIDWLEGEAVL